MNVMNRTFFSICCGACDLNRKMCVCFSSLFYFLVKENNSLSLSKINSSPQIHYASFHSIVLQALDESFFQMLIFNIEAATAAIYI